MWLLRNSPEGVGHVPERTCLGCRRKAPRAQLLRLVVDDAGSLVVDARAVLPGRGAWIHPDPSCLERAERRAAFGRALRVSRAPDAAGVREWMGEHLGHQVGADRITQTVLRAQGRGHNDCEGG